MFGALGMRRFGIIPAMRCLRWKLMGSAGDVVAGSSTDLSQRVWQKKARPVKKRVDRAIEALGNARAERERVTISLNQDWRFRRVENRSESDALPASVKEMEQWEAVNLPHSVRLEPVNASGGRNFQGLCWYSRRLQLPAEWKEKSVQILFEGAMQVAEVWLNDQKIATNYCGYLPFGIDLTRIAKFGEENILTVRLDNRDNRDVPPGKPQKELDFSYFGGLYRNVKLIVTDRVRISDPILADKVAGGGVFVSFSKVSETFAAVQVRTHVVNEHLEATTCKIVQELLEPAGRVVAESTSVQSLGAGEEANIVQNLAVADPLLWHPDHPHLYQLKTTLIAGEKLADEMTTRIGIRHIQFDREHGLRINGEKFFSVGANRHQDHPYVGYALPDSVHYRDVKKLREAGFSSFRSHYPQSPAFMDACDELGMLAIVSNPGWQFVGGKLFQERCVQNARVMVRRDRNHPCVILWEAALNESKNGPIHDRLQQAVHEEYPGDQCFTAGDRDEGTDGWDVDYLHNDGSKAGWIREWGDQVDNWTDQQSRSRVARAWGEHAMLTQVRSHALRLNEIFSSADFKRLGGACLWAGIDCQRGYHREPFQGGVLDGFRIGKFDYYFMQSQRSPDVRVPGLDDGPMVFVANFATFLSPTTVMVFSNCEEVRLTIDGKEVGRKKPDANLAIPHPPVTFDVDCFEHEQSTMYMTGVALVEKPPVEVVAEGIIGGKVVATHRVRPPGVARTIQLEADLCGRELVADGADWVRVYARICDSHGTLCPLAADEVEFVVEGDGRIIGDDRARGNLVGANPARAEAGIATALVQAGRSAGKIVVTASGFGLTPGRIEITSRKAE
jgi:beta-galactosidase